MKKIDWSAFSIEQLKAMSLEIADQIALQEAKQQGVQEILDLISKKGLSIEDFAGQVTRRRVVMLSRTGSARPKVPVKYAHPKNSELTWTGRGKQPKWLVAELKKGKKIESFLLTK